MSERCEKCGAEVEIGAWPWCPHGAFSADHLAVIDDTIPGGMPIENIAKTPKVFYSKSEWKRYCKEHGLINRVEHVGVPGTDKSPHTQRWV